MTELSARLAGDAGSSAQSGATGPLLETKLYIPTSRTGLVPRPRLMERLDQGTSGKLTLASAPAGFGKTTLLAAWARRTAGDRSTAWVSLDQSDNDPRLLWSYIIAALRTVDPDVGESALSLLRSAQPPPIEVLLAGLINEISAVPSDLALVLDDYHAIDAEPVHRGIAFLLDHLPPRMHLVIATRADPPLPLARLRARGELTELRAADLRFAPDEAAAFLNQAMGLRLSATEIAALETRTEGWIAGLQLAALSMQGRQDVHEFIRTFAGDDHYIVDYLVEEVLQRQPQHVRSFLLQTSILDQMSGPLCDAITGREDGKALLEALERGNLFVVPLDSRRQWFRYHHLFADVLRAHAMEEQPDEVLALHRRASEWYQHNGGPAEAVRHALAAGDFERAADLVELAGRTMLTGRQDELLMRWLRALPDGVIGNRPVLSVYYALALVGVDPEAAESRLRDAERWQDAVEGQRPGESSDQMVVVDDDGFRSLPGTIAIVRAYRAGAGGDLPGIVHHAGRAWDLLPEGDHLWRGAAAGLLGLAYWTSGDLEAAYRAFADAWAVLRMTGDATQEASGAFVLADIRRAQGRLREAARLYEQALERLASHGRALPAPAADLLVGMGELRIEHGDLEGAARYLERSRKLSEHRGISEHRHRWHVAMARLAEARGDLDRALDLLDEAERLYERSPAPDVRPIAALKARLWVRQGRVAEAVGWASQQELSIDDDLGYLREFEHVTLARLRIAQYAGDRSASHLHDARVLLERLERAAHGGARMGSLVEILALQARVHEEMGDITRALASLERALTVAEPEGYVQTFVDEREPMRGLVRRVAAAGTDASPYALKLLAAFEEARHATAAPAPAGLVEPLTAREVEVLRLIRAGMRNQEIADHLFISLSTVKRHIANAYGKLGVSHRVEAVARANELNLL
jgi:LuxR family transcriptional regulator, maltose regulon positive regulatory protein